MMIHLYLSPHIQITDTWNTNTTPFLPLTSNLGYNHYFTISIVQSEHPFSRETLVQSVMWARWDGIHWFPCPVHFLSLLGHHGCIVRDTSLLESEAQRLPGRVEQLDGGDWSVALSIATGFYHKHVPFPRQWDRRLKETIVCVSRSGMLLSLALRWEQGCSHCVQEVQKRGR